MSNAVALWNRRLTSMLVIDAFGCALIRLRGERAGEGASS